MRILTGRKISDPTTGFQAMNKRVFTFYSLTDNFPYDYPDADTIITSCFAGFRVKEIPVVMHDRMEGKSMTAGIHSLIYVTKMFISILITLIRKRKIANDLC